MATTRASQEVRASIFWHHPNKTWTSVIYGSGQWEQSFCDDWQVLLHHTNKRLSQINDERSTT